MNSYATSLARGEQEIFAPNRFGYHHSRAQGKPCFMFSNGLKSKYQCESEEHRRIRLSSLPLALEGEGDGGAKPMGDRQGAANEAGSSSTFLPT